MDPGRSLSLVVTMAPGNSKGHSDWLGCSDNVASGYQHNPWWWPRPLESAWLSMATGARDVNTDPGCSGAIDSDMTPSRSLDLDITMVLSSKQTFLTTFTVTQGGKRACHISPPPTAFISSSLPLSTAYEAFYFSFSPISPPHIRSSQQSCKVLGRPRHVFLPAMDLRTLSG
ncbi:hypothetical protein STEG23_024892 [Scotinomys teguina]